MSNHPSRPAGSPMTRQSYLKLARELRHFADLIETSAERATPQQKRTLSQALTNARRCTDRADARHNGRRAIADQLFDAHVREGQR